MESKKQKTMMSSPIRTLTDLPATVIDEILSLIPFEEALRTCVLSRTWRRRWLSIPDLDLSGAPIQIAVQIILRHSGNVRLLKADSGHCWVAVIARSGGGSTLRSLDLVNFNGSLNSIALFCPHLTKLRLAGCSLYINQEPEHCFAGFKDLRSLYLVELRFRGDLSVLFSGCPLLETATLMDINMLESGQKLDVVGLNLRTLELVRIADGNAVSNVDEISITSAPVLEVADLDCEVLRGGTSSRCKVMKVLGCMPNIKKLNLSYGVFKFPLDGCIPGRLSVSFNYLKFLSLDVNFASLSEVLLTLCLLRSIPNLQELECQGLPFEIEDVRVGQGFWEAHEYRGELDTLETVKMTGILCAQVELDFIQFVLAKAKLLKTMTVSFDSPITDDKFVMSEILQFPRVSKQTEILFA